MSSNPLKAALDQVPFLNTLNLQVMETTPGSGSLIVPAESGVLDHTGAIHSAVLFALGEVVIAVALGTTPLLTGVQQLRQASRVTYISPCMGPAHANISVDSDEMTKKVVICKAEGQASVELNVSITDNSGKTVATVISLYKLVA